MGQFSMEITRPNGSLLGGNQHAALQVSLGAFCQIVPDPDDGDRQTLSIEYPTLYPNPDVLYVQHRVKLEAGARSALDPSTTASAKPYIAEDLTDGWAFEVPNLQVIEPARTYLEKLLILHGAHCGYRDEARLPTDKDRVSRHYYDVAMITATDLGKAALNDEALLTSVREHNLVAFKQAWKRFEQAVPGSVCVVPQDALRSVIEKDYAAMQGMMLGAAPKFSWVMGQLEIAEALINRR